MSPTRTGRRPGTRGVPAVTVQRLDGGVTWLADVPESVAGLALAPGGDVVAVATLGGDVVLVDAVTGAAGGVSAQHDGGAFAIAWDPAGELLASGGGDGRVALTGRGRTTVSVDVGGWVADLEWSPDGQVLAVAAGRALLLVSREGEVLHRRDGHASTVSAVAFSGDGSRVAAACYGGLHWYLTAGRGQEPVRTFAWKGSLLTVRVSPDGRWVASGNQDASVHIWRLWSGEDAEMRGYPEKVDCLAFDRTSRWMACGGTREISLWDFSGKGPMGRGARLLEGHEAQVSALAWQPDGALLASGARDGSLAVWGATLPGGGPSALLRHDAGARITGVVWRPGAATVLFATTTATVGAWQVRR